MDIHIHIHGVMLAKSVSQWFLLLRHLVLYCVAVYFSLLAEIPA
jgi:hypothetical protein